MSRRTSQWPLLGASPPPPAVCLPPPPKLATSTSISGAGSFAWPIFYLYLLGSSPDLKPLEACGSSPAATILKLTCLIPAHPVSPIQLSFFLFARNEPSSLRCFSSGGRSGRRTSTPRGGVSWLRPCSILFNMSLSRDHIVLDLHLHG